MRFIRCMHVLGSWLLTKFSGMWPRNCHKSSPSHANCDEIWMVQRFHDFLTGIPSRFTSTLAKFAVAPRFWPSLHEALSGTYAAPVTSSRQKQSSSISTQQHACVPVLLFNGLNLVQQMAASASPLLQGQSTDVCCTGMSETSAARSAPLEVITAAPGAVRWPQVTSHLTQGKRGVQQRSQRSQASHSPKLTGSKLLLTSPRAVLTQAVH